MIPPSQQHLYRMDNHIIIPEFRREHEPLDGSRVKYIPCRKGKQYGFVDKETKAWVIEPQFTEVYAVYAEGAIVGINERFGLVNYKGVFLIPPYFENLYKEGNLFHALTTAMDTSVAQPFNLFVSNFYFDEKGKLLFSANAHQQGAFRDGDSLAWFRFGDTARVYNRKGRQVAKIPVDNKKYLLGTFNNCLVYREDGPSFAGYTWYDTRGHLKYKLRKIAQSASSVYRMNDTLFALVSDEGISFVNDKDVYYSFGADNGMIFPGQDQMFDNWLRGNELLPVKNEATGLSGYLDGHGKMQIPCRYRYAGPFVAGEAAVDDAATGKLGFIDKQGRQTVPPVFIRYNIDRMEFGGMPMRYSDSLCAVAIGVRPSDQEVAREYYYGYADRKGEIKLVMPDSIILAGDFSDGLAPVVAKGGNLGFINKKGETVIPFKYSVAVQGAYPFPELVIPRFINGFAYLKAFKGYIDKSGYEYFSGAFEPDEYHFSH